MSIINVLRRPVNLPSTGQLYDRKGLLDLIHGNTQNQSVAPSPQLNPHLPARSVLITFSTLSVQIVVLPI